MNVDLPFSVDSPIGHGNGMVDPSVENSSISRSSVNRHVPGSTGPVLLRHLRFQQPTANTVRLFPSAVPALHPSLLPPLLLHPTLRRSQCRSIRNRKSTVVGKTNIEPHLPHLLLDQVQGRHSKQRPPTAAERELRQQGQAMAMVVLM